MDTILHIYGQGAWHDPVYICGDRKGLEALRDALTKAIERGSCDNGRAIVNDGEGYQLVVRRIDGEDDLDRLAVPYTWDVAAEKRKVLEWPMCEKKSVCGKEG